MKNIYEDARLYDALVNHQLGGSGLSYWQKQCVRYGGPVLELACGSGRLTIPLAEAGLDIEGLDISPAMLALAREKSRGLHLPWHLGNATNFTVDRQFSFIFLPANSITHLLNCFDLLSCLNHVRRHFTKKGRFALDYFNPALTLLLRGPEVRSPVAEFAHPDTGETVTVTETSAYDSATQINHIQWLWRFAGGAETFTDLPMRVYFPQELDDLLTLSGFVIEEKYGDYDLSPFIASSQKQLIVTRPA